MEMINDIVALETLYGTPGDASIRKVARRMTPAYRRWIMASQLCILSTVGPDGTDGSPRGDDGPVALELDPGTLAMPDWRGNNRLDSLRNIINDDRVALMFVVPGSNNVVRVNGTAQITTDKDLCARFARGAKGTLLPATVIVISIGEIYIQCARALLRAGTWVSGDQSAELPSAGDILTEMTNSEFDGAAYDQSWGARAKETMW